MLTSEVENFPGFPDGVLGPDFMDALRRQAEKFGAQIVDEEVVGVDLRVHPFKISTNSRVEEALSVIVATGASAKWLGLPGEQRLRGKGVSGCAVCDGYFFRGRDVVVVGGGDSAMEDALFLTKYASHVTIVHRRREFRASKIMQRRVLTNPKISVILDSVVEDVLGTNKLEGVVVKNLVTGERTHLAVAGLFVAIGHEPNTKLFRGQLELGEKGYIRVYDQTTRTNVEGVFELAMCVTPATGRRLPLRVMAARPRWMQRNTWNHSPKRRVSGFQRSPSGGRSAMVGVLC